MSDQDEDAFDHMHHAMASQGGHLVVVGEVIKERDAALAEVERLRGQLVQQAGWLRRQVGDQELIALGEAALAEDEVRRLRDLLRRLEWAGDKREEEACPACHNWPDQGHEPSCWLAAELRST